MRVPAGNRTTNRQSDRTVRAVPSQQVHCSIPKVRARVSAADMWGMPATSELCEIHSNKQGYRTFSQRVVTNEINIRTNQDKQIVTNYLCSLQQHSSLHASDYISPLAVSHSTGNFHTTATANYCVKGQRVLRLLIILHAQNCISVSW